MCYMYIRFHTWCVTFAAFGAKSIWDSLNQSYSVQLHDILPKLKNIPDSGHWISWHWIYFMSDTVNIVFLRQYASPHTVLHYSFRFDLWRSNFEQRNVYKRKSWWYGSLVLRLKTIGWGTMDLMTLRRPHVGLSLQILRHFETSKCYLGKFIRLVPAWGCRYHARNWLGLYTSKYEVSCGSEVSCNVKT